jgi:N-acyl homoserine lactone hydrolase
MKGIGLRRVDYGYFVRPADESGGGVARVEPTLGYVIDHPTAGLILFDTGMGEHPEVDAWYHPTRIPLAAALRTAGAHLDDIRMVTNCHLHFDHCGGNPQLAGRPVFAQQSELDLARAPESHTFPELVDHPGARIEPLSGEAEIAPHVHIFPTPGHTAGHQSLVIRQPTGTVLVVAGQSHENATSFTTDALAHHTGVGTPPAWIERLLAMDPARVVFAHDNAVWTPGTWQA